MDFQARVGTAFGFIAAGMHDEITDPFGPGLVFAAPIMEVTAAPVDDRPATLFGPGPAVIEMIAAAFFVMSAVIVAMILLAMTVVLTASIMIIAPVVMVTAMC